MGRGRFAKAVDDSRVLGRGATRVVVTGVVLLALSGAIPLGVVQFYVQALAGLLALWPLALAMRHRPEAVAAARSTRTASATTQAAG